MDDKDILWKQYSQNVDLYKFYLELVIKLNIFLYAISGSILSFYFSKTTEPLLKYSLVLPIVINLAFAVFFIYGAKLLKITREEVFNLRDRLGLIAAPEIQVLVVFLWIFAIILLVVAASMVGIVICR